MKLAITQKTVGMFVSKDGMRPSLQGVKYDAKEKALVMTNGHILAVVPVEDGPAVDFILLVVAFPKGKGESTIITFDPAMDVITIERKDKKGQDAGTLTLKAIEGPYPQWKNLFEHMPEKIELRAPIGFNMSFFQPFYELSKDLGGIGDAKLTFYGPNHAVKVETVRDHDKPGEVFKSYGLIMPVRLGK